MNTLEQQVERFRNLPTDFQEALSSFDYDHKLGSIHKKYKLHIDQSVSLENIMSDIIFGDQRSIELTSTIEHELRLPRETAIEIALEINRNILVPIKDTIKVIQGAGTNVETV
jgi:hypothetical protein